MIQTTVDPFAEYEKAVRDLDDGGEWCLERPDNPDIALCGGDLSGQPWAPHAEIPDESLCKRCRAIRDGEEAR